MKASYTIAELRALKGAWLGLSDWRIVDQALIDSFAEVTGDHQWIHVDPVQAAAGPFGSTVAHGYLTLALIPSLLAEIYEVREKRLGINYGLNRVRFTVPVPSGARVRAGARLLSHADVQGGAQLIVEAHVEVEGKEKPACIAEVITRIIF